jgi:F1F0 ATPase subunit 2
MTATSALAITPADAGLLVLAFLGGALLGLIYFGGLWVTIRRLERTANQVLLFGASFLARLVLVLAGFYLISGGRVERLAASLIGFFVARQVMLRWAQLPKKKERNQHGV